RGRLGSLQQLSITIGIFAALLSDAVFATTAGGASEMVWWGLEAWRWMFLVSSIPALIYGVIALVQPESPRYLVLHDKETKAREVLLRVWPHGDVDRELRDMK